MKYTELNLEEGMPNSNDAMIFLKRSIDTYKKNKVECVLIIHGYGSSGKGGIIRNKTRRWLQEQVNIKYIKSFIPGERFDIFNMDALRLKNKYKELESLLKVTNDGVTVVEL